jgi:hypothetical protein
MKNKQKFKTLSGKIPSFFMEKISANFEKTVLCCKILWFKKKKKIIFKQKKYKKIRFCNNVCFCSEQQNRL